MGAPRCTFSTKPRSSQEAHYLPYSRPYHLHTLSLLARQLDPRTPGCNQDGLAPFEFATEHLRLRCPAYTCKISLVGIERRERASRAVRHDRSGNGTVVWSRFCRPCRWIRWLAAALGTGASCRHRNREVIEDGEEVDASTGRERHGEIQLRGPTIFREYWKNAEATTKEFTEDEDGQGKWFKTGDVAIRKTVQGAGNSGQEWAKGPLYFIQGRKSADIIKTGGEKVSALEIEREMLSLPYVSEVAVVGLPSEAWGQKVAAVVVLSEQGKTAGRNGKAWSALDMRRALKDMLANYKIPQEMKVVESIPRNAMGKINKKQLVIQIWGEPLEGKNENGAVQVPNGSV